MMLRRLLLPVIVFSIYGASPAFAQNDGIVEVPPLPPADPAPAPLPDLDSPQPPPTPAADQEPAPFPTLPPAETPPAETPAPAQPPAAASATPSATVSNLLKEVTESEPNGFEPSYGNREHSLFFSKNDADNIRHILRLYESGSLDKAAPSDAGIAELLQDLQPKDEQKQLVYPRFKLRSVIYRSPAEWVVLLNENRISSYSNNADREITVLNVSKSTVSFRWKPTDEVLLAAIGKDAAMRGHGKPAAGNRIAKGARTSFDKTARAIFFTLSVNQDFDSQTFEITEGGLPNKKTADNAAPAPAATATPPATAPATAPAGQAAPQDASRPSIRPGIPNVSAPASGTQSSNAPAAPAATTTPPAAATTTAPPAATTTPPTAAAPADNAPAGREAVPQSAILRSLGLE